ncbi:hypothetical protein [Gimesia aquarii]|nr:hypothetical protein [Gimesia aquarii]
MTTLTSQTRTIKEQHIRKGSNLQVNETANVIKTCLTKRKKRPTRN